MTEGPASDREQAQDRPIAIVGLGCRFADARGPAELWEIVRSGRNAVREVPAHRIELGYDIDYFYDPRPGIPGRICSRLGGFLDHPELFDPAAYGLTPRDAIGMEPQQRLMVEVTWDALADAGIPTESLEGERVAVIFGFMAEDYSRQRAACLDEASVFRSFDVFTAAGMSHAVLSGRVSHLLGVTGPSLTLDTACSSSLYATHLACQSLQRGESTMAIAGGANVFLTPEGQIALSRSGMMSPTGQCRAFDAGANGFVRAEGAGVVVLRPLDDALAAGDRIYAVIRGTGASSDGRGGGHMMAPSRAGQVQAMRDAYRRAGLDPARVHYVEAHGTGTVIGDPVEIAALAEVMGPGRPAAEPLLVASVKGNLGHAESASGVAGLIKTALAIHHRELPAQLHFEKPSPAIPWDEIPIRVQRESTPWPRSGPALAGVNSFGISGTNAHVILESPPEWGSPRARSRRPRDAEGSRPALRVARSGASLRSDEESRPRLIPLSAHDPRALEQLVERHRDDARADRTPDLADLGYTLGCRRSQGPLRLGVVAASSDELADELDAWLAGSSSGACHVGTAPAGQRPGLAMVFPGQGSQWLGMGRRLLARERAFAAAIERLDRAYATQVDWSLRAVLEGRAGFDWRERLDVLQPLLVAVEIALAGLFSSWGVRPDRVIGQSMGEIAAAHVAGCLDTESVALLACQRGLVVARASGKGAMGVVARPATDLLRELADWEGRVEIAGTSAPSTTLVAGDREAVEGLVATLVARDVFARRLEVDFASHCFHMDPLLDDFRQRIATLMPRKGTLPFHSTVDGETKSGPELDVDYWVRNLRAPVSLPPAVEAALEGGASLFLEVAPHPTLSRAIGEIAEGRDARPVCVGSLQREQDDTRAMLGSLAALHVNGVPIDFAALHPTGRFVDTPLQPLQRKRYWFGERSRAHRPRSRHPLLGVRRDDAQEAGRSVWDVLLDLDSAPWLDDHRVGGRRSIPPSLHLELALAVGDDVWPGQPVELLDVTLRPSPELPPEGRVAIQVVLRREGAESGALEILDRATDGRWMARAHARIRVGPRGESLACDEDPLPEEGPVREGAGGRTPGAREEPLRVSAILARLERQGLTLGRRCQTLKELTRRDARAEAPTLRAHLMLPRACESDWYAYHAHPALLEGVLQVLGEAQEPARALQAVGLRRLRLERPLESECHVQVTPTPAAGLDAFGSSEGVEGDVELRDRGGRVIGRIEGLRARSLPTARGVRAPSATRVHRLAWRDLPLDSDPGRTADDTRWIVIADDEEEGRWLSSALAERGQRSFLCERPEALAALVERVRGEPNRPWGLVLLLWADRLRSARQGPARDRVFPIREWTQAITEHARDAGELWIATRGLQRIAVGPATRGDGPEDGRSDASEAPSARPEASQVEALARLSTLERCRLFDASGSLETTERERLPQLMGAGLQERQIVARGRAALGTRLAALDEPDAASEGGSGTAVRRARAAAPRISAAGRDFRAVVDPSGDGTEVVLRERMPPREPGPDEVEVEVRAASLASLDVLGALGLARSDALAPRGLGRDFAGVVTRLGQGVTDLAVGDRVMGIGRDAIARFVVAPRAQLVPMPPALDFDAAAALPLAYVVASLALEELARLQPGQRVLIRSAGGGVGLAAVAIARAYGARVFATTSRPERRRLLEARGATVSSAAEDLEAGFDVVLTGGEAASLRRDLAWLRPGGCLVDLAPRRDYALAGPGSISLDGNRRLASLDLEALVGSQPGLLAKLLRRTAEAVGDGRWPTLPRTVFPVAEVGRALGLLTRNRHAGRVTLDLRTDVDTLAIAPLDETPCLAEGTGTALLVCGEEGLRGPLADWLRRRGAIDVRIVEPGGLPITLDALRRHGHRLRALVHVESPGAALEEDAIRALVEASRRDPDLVALIGLRDPWAGETRGGAIDWERRALRDRLLVTAAASGAASAFALSVRSDLAAARLLPLLDATLAETAAGESRIGMDEEEREALQAAPGSSLLADSAWADGERASRMGRMRSELDKLAPGERRRSVEAFVVDALATVLGLGERERNALDLSRPLDGLGLDSLMTMELFVALSRELELEIARDWFEGVPTPSGVSAVLLERIDASIEAGGMH